MKIRTTLFYFFLLIFLNVKSQIGISNNAPNNDPNHLINNVLVGGGVTISNVQFSGNNQQIGFFSNGNSIGMSSGTSSFCVSDARLGANAAQHFRG